MVVDNKKTLELANNIAFFMFSSHFDEKYHQKNATTFFFVKFIFSKKHTDLKLYFCDITGDVTRTRERRRKAKKTNSLTLDALLVELTGKLHGS